MRKPGKKHTETAKKVDRSRRYTLDEATSLVKEASYAKFDETVDLAVRLGVNPKHADQMVRGALVLPHGVGKEEMDAGVNLRHAAGRQTTLAVSAAVRQ